jgi:hypothetical protein
MTRAFIGAFIGGLFALVACDDGRSPGDAGPRPDAQSALDGGPGAPDAGPIGGSCETGCTGFSYCDLGADICRPGCADDTRCGANERCELSSRTCVCAESAHLCGSACVDSASPATCGDRCAACPSVANGEATCDDGECGIDCDDGYESCGGACVACPTVGVVSTTCAGAVCMPEQCAEGYGPCASGCCAWGHAVIEGVDAEHVTELAMTVVGSTVHAAFADTYGAPSHAEGSRSSWTVESLYDVSYLLEPPLGIVTIGSTAAVVAMEDDITVSLRRDASTWARATLEATVGLEALRYMGCASAASTAMCVSSDRYANRLIRVSATGALTHEGFVYESPSRDAAIAVTASGEVHTAFLDSFGNVTYRSTTAPFGDEDPEASELAGDYYAVELALDASGEPHLLIVAGGVFYGRRVAGEWVTERIGNGSYLRRRSALRADGRGHLHAVWAEDATSGTSLLQYGYFDGARWTVSQVDNRAPRVLDMVLIADRPQVLAAYYEDRTLESYWLP